MIRIDYYLIITAALFITCRAQISVELPSSLSVIVNDAPYLVSEGWMDSLIAEAALGKFSFVIVGASSTPRAINTSIQVAQILPLPAVYRQAILYFAMLDSEADREKEKVNIYPYFHDIDGAPFLTVTYEAEGHYTIKLNHWLRLPVPPPPDFAEREVFNQVLQTSFSGVERFSSLSKEIFKKIAHRNNMSVEKVRSVYQNTILWQQAVQFSDRRPDGPDLSE